MGQSGLFQSFHTAVEASDLERPSKTILFTGNHSQRYLGLADAVEDKIDLWWDVRRVYHFSADNRVPCTGTCTCTCYTAHGCVRITQHNIDF